jgi:hypothetical protein
MELDDILTRIESRLAALGLSAHAASLAAKKPDAIRNLKRAVRNGDRRGVTTETLIALAPILETTAAWLLEGIGDPTPGHRVSVVGRIGAGAEISPEFEQIPPEGLYEIEVPFPIAGDAIAFQVEGDSMWPRYDPGDIVICWKVAQTRTEADGWEAAVRLTDGRRYLKTIRRVSKDRFDLVSHNASPILNVQIEWACKVFGNIRTGEWKLLETAPRPPARHRR